METWKAYNLRKNHKNYMPRKMIFFDTETTWTEENDIQKHYFRVGWSYFCYRSPKGKITFGEWKEWKDKDSFCKYIEKKAYDKQVVYLFAHNIFFDLQVIGFFKYFTKSGWKLDFVYDQGMTFILVIHKGERMIKALSTTNFFDTDLRSIGEMLGVNKLEVDLEDDSEESISIYCKRDVEIIVRAMMEYFKFLQDNDLGNFGITRASQAMNAYRHRFMPRKITIHKNDKVRELERNAYYGGRTECFYIGEVPGNEFVSLDINSMYPYVMKTYKLPHRLIDYVESPGYLETIDILKKFSIVAHVRVSTNDPVYAVRYNGKVIFPVGEFDTYVCTGALKYAIENSHVVNIYSMSIYEDDYIFSDYVDFFYDLKTKYKKEGNKIYSKITKIFLNSLYGKFGQKKPIMEKVEKIDYDGFSREEVYDAVTGEVEIVYQLFNTLVTIYGEEEHPKAFPAIPAHITEYGRLVLWNIIKDIGRNRVLYCDTDSVKIRKEDMKYVKWPIDNEKLGALKIENEFSHFVIHGLKDYETDIEVKLKGVPKNATKITDNVYEYNEFLRSAEHMNKGITDYFVVQKTTKVLYREYDKGVVTENGFVEPISLSEVSSQELAF